MTPVGVHRFLPVLTAVLLGSACGTTVPQAAQVGAAPSAAQQAPGGTTGTSGGAASDSFDVPAGAGPAGSTTGGGVARPTVPGRGMSPGTAPGPVAPGARVMRPVKVGLVVLTDANRAFQGLGIDVDLGDQERQATAAAEWLNARGGIGGRKVVLDFFRTSLGTFLADNANTLQAACSHFVEDAKVDVLLQYLNNATALEDCVAARGLLVARANYGGRGDAAYANGRIREPSNLSTTQTMVHVLDGLGRAGYWRGHKVGWFLPDTAEHVATARSAEVRAALRRNGISGLETVHYDPVNVQQGSQAASAAVLRFRSNGVDRVILTGLGSTTFFMNAASSQRYVPGYAISTDSAPSATPTAVNDDEQLKAVRGIGWQPPTDVGFAQVGSPTRGMRDCVDAMKKDRQGTSDTALANALLICDGLFLLDYGADRSGGRVDPTSFGAAVARDPVGYSSSLSRSSDLRLGAGVTSYQTFRFDPSRRVFVHDAPPVSLRR